MPKTTKPSALPISGQVTAKSAYGIKIEGIEDWLNWSLPEYRKEPWEADDVQKGDWVDMEVSGKYIKSICLVEAPAEEGMVRSARELTGPEEVPFTFRTLAPLGRKELKFTPTPPARDWISTVWVIFSIIPPRESEGEGIT